MTGTTEQPTNTLPEDTIEIARVDANCTITISVAPQERQVHLDLDDGLPDGMGSYLTTRQALELVDGLVRGVLAVGGNAGDVIAAARPHLDREGTR